MLQLTRSASLTGFAELARSLGLDPWRLARSAGVPIAALSDPDLKIPVFGVARMLEAAARCGGAADFGLRLAQTRRLSNMGAVGLIAREQPTLSKALAVMAQYQWMQNDAVSLRTEETPEIAVLRLEFRGDHGRVSAQGVELSIGVLCRNIRALLGEAWRPEAVYFTHPRPDAIDSHRRLFGVTPVFGDAFNGLVLTRADLDRPIPAADPDMARQVERYVRQFANPRRRSVRNEVEELIVLLLPTGLCTAEQVARRLGVNRRTLHRRLAGEGVTFSGLLLEQRRDLAVSLMSNPDRTLGAIAEHLGFSSASAFSHWHRDVFGAAARDHRGRDRP